LGEDNEISMEEADYYNSLKVVKARSSLARKK